MALAIADVWRLLKQLRPYLGAGGPARRDLATSLVMVLFEGVGVGLLVPLLSLLLGGTNAVPMRPIQWLQSAFPNHSPAFYVGACCVAIIVAIGAKNVAAYVAVLFSARLKRRVATSLRGCAVRGAPARQPGHVRSRPGGEFANVFLVETYRTTVAIDTAVSFAQRVGHRAVLRRRALLHFVAAHWLVVVLGLVIGGTLGFIYRRLGQAGHETDRPEPSAVGGARTVVRGGPGGARDQRQERGDRAVPAGQHRAGGSEEETTRAHSLLFPLVETLGVIGAMVIVACAYIFFVRPATCSAAICSATGSCCCDSCRC